MQSPKIEKDIAEFSDELKQYNMKVDNEVDALVGGFYLLIKYLMIRDGHKLSDKRLKTLKKEKEKNNGTIMDNGKAGKSN